MIRDHSRRPDYPQPSHDEAVAVDRYFQSELIGGDPFQHILDANTEAGLVPHDVSPLQAGLLSLLVSTCRTSAPPKVLEIGTLGGYSAAWLAQGAGPDGQVDTLEVDETCVRVAQANLKMAGLSERVTVHAGSALETLDRLSPFYDLVFIDADKPSNPQYLQAALRLTRLGGLIVADNVVRGGAVVDGESADAKVIGVRRYTEMVAQSPRLFSTAIQTTGVKGWDGFLISRVG